MRTVVASSIRIPPMTRAQIDDFCARVRQFAGESHRDASPPPITTPMRAMVGELARACREMRWDDTDINEDIALSKAAAQLDAAGAHLDELVRLRKGRKR